jgi:uncharacterized protein YbjQ (UPF0145 family)
MLLVTSNNIENKKFHHIGLVQGCVVRTKHIGRDIAAGFKSLVGGEIVGYTEMMNEARGIATQRMIDSAVSLGADAVVCVRFSTCSVMGGASEVMAYGTAIKYI